MRIKRVSHFSRRSTAKSIPATLQPGISSQSSMPETNSYHMFNASTVFVCVALPRRMRIDGSRGFRLACNPGAFAVRTLSSRAKACVSSARSPALSKTSVNFAGCASDVKTIPTRTTTSITPIPISPTHPCRHPLTPLPSRPAVSSGRNACNRFNSRHALIPEKRVHNTQT